MKIVKWILFSTALFLSLLLSCNGYAKSHENGLKNDQGNGPEKSQAKGVKVKLTHVKHTISSLRSNLKSNQTQVSQNQHKLKIVETRRARAYTQLRKTNHKLSTQHRKLSVLQKKAKRYQRKLTPEIKLLSEQLQAAYQLGRQPYLKLLLNQQNPSEISRTLNYYQYLNQDRLNNIARLQKLLAVINKNQQAILHETKTLASIKHKQTTERQHWRNLAAHRKTVLKDLHKQLSNQHLRLNILLADKRKLEQTIKEISHNPWHYSAGIPFKNLKHKLVWPTKGKIIQNFGSKIQQSELKYNGVLLKARSGQPIHAIAGGRVIFAKWMAGYGLLIIVNHGNGYMSLYGRNQNLYRKVGDVIAAGDVIASVGNSGGFQSSGLYFEIRHNVSALNPAIWCRRFA